MKVANVCFKATKCPPAGWFEHVETPKVQQLQNRAISCCLGFDFRVSSSIFYYFAIIASLHVVSSLILASSLGKKFTPSPQLPIAPPKFPHCQPGGKWKTSVEMENLWETQILVQHLLTFSNHTNLEYAAPALTAAAQSSRGSRQHSPRWARACWTRCWSLQRLSASSERDPTLQTTGEPSSTLGGCNGSNLKVVGLECEAESIHRIYSPLKPFQAGPCRPVCIFNVQPMGQNSRK